MNQIPIETKLLILDYFNKKELNILGRINKEFLKLSKDKNLKANKYYHTLIYIVNKKIKELYPFNKSRNIDRFSRYNEYKINIHTDFSVLKANVSAFLDMVYLYSEIFDSEILIKFSDIIKQYNNLISMSSEISKGDKQILIFKTYESLKRMTKYLDKSNNPILKSISNVTNLVVKIEPSFYKVEPKNLKPQNVYIYLY